MNPLAKACRLGKLLSVKEIVRSGNARGAAAAFRWACAKGHLDIAKWLLIVQPPIDVRALGDDAFRCACVNGHLHVAKWLLCIEPSTSTAAHDNALFYWSCRSGHLRVAKWLLSMEPLIEVRSHEDAAFRWACRYGYFDVAKWLQRLTPVLKSKSTQAFRSRRVLQLILFFNYNFYVFDARFNVSMSTSGMQA